MRRHALVAFSTPRESHPGRMIAWMVDQGVDCVVVLIILYDDIRRYLIPALQAEQYHFAPVFEVEEPYTVVLRFVP